MAPTMFRGRSALPSVGLLIGLVFIATPAPSAFLCPALSSQGQTLQSLHATGAGSFAGLAAPREGRPVEERGGRTAMAATGVGAKVLGAMSAGLVAAVVSAMLAAVTEPVMNRVLVKRMSIKEAMAEMSPSLMLSFFTTTMSTNLIKFPLFEAVSMFLSLLPNMSKVVGGLIVGFIFTTATLPITNFRYRMSIQTPMAEALKPEVLYQAYLPTVVRDMVYAVGRNILTAVFLLKFSGLSPASPALMFPVVIGACVISAPFNEARGFLLQSGAKKLSFTEFFKPANFIRSTTLGALNMGVSVATGYFLTPIVARNVAFVHKALDSGNPLALIGIVLSLDLAGWLLASGFSKKVFTRRIAANKDVINENTQNISALVTRMEAMEAANKRLADKVVSLGGKAEEP